MIRFIAFVLGALLGAIVGILVGVFVVSPASLSNPDLPGGMAWLFLIVISAITTIFGGVFGFTVGPSLIKALRSTSRR